MAIGAISALTQAGLQVPEDISIVGYDDVPEAEFASPPLTTVRQPMDEVGQMATRLLIQHINNPNAAPTQILLDTELIIRSSVGQRKGDI
jgi:LacI family transcriptional regulator